MAVSTPFEGSLPTLPPVTAQDLHNESVLGEDKKTPPSGATRRWLNLELKKGLLDHLTNLVHARLPREEREEILGEVGLCVAQWCTKGSFDQLLADTGRGPNRKNISEWVFRSMITRLLHRGKDAQLRDRTGARTHAEVKQGKVAVVAHKLAPETWTAVRTYSGDEGGSSTEQESSQDIMDKSRTPEGQAVADSNDVACFETAKEILRVKCPRGAVRRIKVLEAVLRGAQKQELENDLGVSTLRAAFLRQEVRDDLRDGLEMLEKARKILKLVLEEPCSTQAEIELESGLTPKEVKEATRLLVQKRLITVSKVGCYQPTQAAHNESF